MAEQVVGPDVDGDVGDVVISQELHSLVELAAADHGAGGFPRRAQVVQAVPAPVAQLELPVKAGDVPVPRLGDPNVGGE